MVDRVGSSWSWGVISRRLIGKATKSETIWIQERRRETELIDSVCSRGRIHIFEIMVFAMMPRLRQLVCASLRRQNNKAHNGNIRTKSVNLIFAMKILGVDDREWKRLPIAIVVETGNDERVAEGLP